jgi:Kef-type K+ transport system membrane component KefB/nucleotide-binding universal stress UspA family protein
MEQVIKPLGGHEILLVLLQLSALLTIARLGAEFVKRLGLPTVVGELAAGIALGPTVFGHFLPGAFAQLFPAHPEQFHLLEIISWLGMVLLMLLTGLETDVRLLRNLGRTAIAASVFGMLVPFVFGFGLGMVMPDHYVATPDHRMMFGFFLATALSISAMPVIAKILLDLDLTRRNIGVMILSAGVVDDTTGWLILSLIAGAATTGDPNLGALAFSLVGTGLFLVFAAVILFPILRFAFRVATDRFESKDTDLVLMIVVTLLCAAVTEMLHVHAVFGAFVAGCVIRQVPRLREETLHKVESVTFSIFAPIFFGIVGLKVDLWKLGGSTMLLWVLGVATAGKLIGCVVGGLLGGLRIWESLSIAVAMNARGAMGLVVATIGLSLGILNQEMYSIVVMVAIATSFMAPILLRLTMSMVRMTDEEAARMAAVEARGLFDPEKLRVLVPTAGGPNALSAASIGMRVAKQSAHPLTVFYVERVTGLMDRIFGGSRRSAETDTVTDHIARMREMAAEAGVREPETRRQVGKDVAGSIGLESAKGYDLVMVGASESRRGMRGELLEKLVGEASSHVAIVKKRGKADGPYRRILVPVDGSFLSRVAVEFAVRYAEGVGDGAEVTIALVTDRDRSHTSMPPPAIVPASTPPPSVHRSGTTVPQARANSLMLMVDSLAKDGGLEKLSPVFKATKVKTKVVVRQPSDGGVNRLPVLAEANSGKYDLVVLGAENRAIHYRLFFGYDNEKLVEESRITVVLIVPKVKAA